MMLYVNSILIIFILLFNKKQIVGRNNQKRKEIRNSLTVQCPYSSTEYNTAIFDKDVISNHKAHQYLSYLLCLAKLHTFKECIDLSTLYEVKSQDLMKCENIKYYHFYIQL